MTAITATSAPKVSVATITYNHECFIAQAIESVLAQQTNFRIEMVIGDDASTDRTREIVQRYASAQPDVIRPLFHPHNVGMTRNYQMVTAACRGEYVAVLEGDDYWTYPHKLQRQVEWLDAHPTCPLCFHNVEVFDQTAGRVRKLYCPEDQPPEVTIDAIVSANPIATCSVVYRRSALPALSEAVRNIPAQDWPYWILLTQTGPAAYLNEVWGGYRWHNSGVWSTKPASYRVRECLKVCAAVRDSLQDRFQPMLAKAVKAMKAQLIEELVAEGRWNEARKPVIDFLLSPPGRFRPPPHRASLYARVLLGIPSEPMRAFARSNAAAKRTE